MKRLTTLVVACVLLGVVHAQTPATSTQNTLDLTKYTDQQRWNRCGRFSALGTIMTIALGKSKGMKVEEIGDWLGKQYAPGWSRTGTPRSLVTGFHRNFMSYPEAVFEIVSASDSAVSWRANRPYLSTFGDARVSYGVTVEEFEQVGILIDKAIGEWMGLQIEEKVDGAWWTGTVRRKS